MIPFRVLSLAVAIVLPIHADAQISWLPKLESQPAPPIEDTEQYHRVTDELERIFKAHHLGEPYPQIVIVEPNADTLKAPARFGSRFKSINVKAYGTQDRTIYVSSLALMQAPQTVIYQIEHTAVHLHVYEHHPETAGWHDHHFEFFCADAGFKRSCRIDYCSYPRAIEWPGAPYLIEDTE